jgi:hypothetical protein
MSCSKRRSDRMSTKLERLEARCCLAVASIDGGRDISEAGGSITVRLTLSEPLAKQASVRLATSGSSATAGLDFRLSPNPPDERVVFAPGETSKSISVIVRNDVRREGNESIRLSLESPVNCELDNNSATEVVIRDDDAYAVSLLGPSEPVRPGNGANFTLRLSSPATRAETFVLSTSDETALANIDYRPIIDREITVPRGASSVRFVVPTIASNSYEPNETFLMRAKATTLDTPSPEAARVTIGANLTPTPSLSVSDVTVAEGNSGSVPASFVVRLSGQHSLPVTVRYETADDSAAISNGDYMQASGTLTFAPGETTKTVAVMVVGDATYELAETFRLLLTNPVAATLSRATAIATITNDDPSPPLPSISIFNASVTEGNSGDPFANFVVTLSSTFVVPVSVGFATQLGTAVATDFLPRQGRLTFAPGETSKTIRVQVIADQIYEPNETFTVRLFEPVRATIAKATGTGTITNDDPRPQRPSITIADASVLEGGSNSTAIGFNVTLSNAYDESVTVIYASSNGTATTADGDFQPAMGVLTFEPGQTSRTVNVLVNGDTKVEADETFALTLSSSTNSTIVRAVAVGTIRNDDSQLPTISVVDASTDEGNSGTKVLAFVVALSAASSQTVTVQYATSDGSATTVGSDYQSLVGTVSFAPGQTSQSISVVVIGDSAAEPDETFSLMLSSASNATLLRSTATGVIRNDDTPSPASAFTIDVVFPDSSLSATQQQAFTQAAARWSQIIVGDLPDVTVGGVTIDDIRITAVGEPIDGAYGTLGSGGPSWAVGDPRPPSRGSMRFDTADLARMETDGTLVPVILHEMGHCLGLGTMWDYRKLMSGGSYTGTNALREYRSIFGISNATSIPTAGSGHWDEATFKTELMTPMAEQAGTPMPISRITIGSLEDLGYTVDYAAADTYVAPKAIEAVNTPSKQQAIWAAFAQEVSARKPATSGRQTGSVGTIARVYSPAAANG